MAKLYDVTLKDLIDQFATDWATLLPRYVGLPPDTGVQPLDTDLSVTASQADRLFALSGPADGVLHVEMESSWSGEIPARLAVYNLLAERKHPGPVYSAVMLLRPAANSPKVTGTLVRAGLNGEYLRFTYAVIRVWELASADLLAGPIGLLPLAMLTDDARPRLLEVVREADDRVGRELGSSPDAHTVRNACSMLLGLRYDKDTMRRLLAEFTMLRESSTFQLILEEGIEKGIEKGLKQGESIGRLQAKREDLTRLGRRRFGASPKAEAELATVSDIDRLNRLFDTLDDHSSWETWIR